VTLSIYICIYEIMFNVRLRRLEYSRNLTFNAGAQIQTIYHIRKVMHKWSVSRSHIQLVFKANSSLFSLISFYDNRNCMFECIVTVCSSFRINV
jgi:hypothetical protein